VFQGRRGGGVEGVYLQKFITGGGTSGRGGGALFWGWVEVPGLFEREI